MLDLSLEPAHIRALRYHNWDAEALVCLRKLKGFLDVPRIFLLISRNMVWGFFTSKGVNFIKMLCEYGEEMFVTAFSQLVKGPFGSNVHKPGVCEIFEKFCEMEGASLDKVISLCKGNFGSNVHKPGVCEIFDKFCEMEGASLDKVILLCKGNFGSNVHKPKALTQFCALQTSGFKFNELVTLLASNFGSMFIKELGRGLIENTLGHLKRLQVPDENLNSTVVTILSSKHIGHVHTRQLVSDILQQCQIGVKRDISVAIQLIRANFTKKDKDSPNFVPRLVMIWETARKNLAKLPTVKTMQRTIHAHDIG